MDEIYAKLKSTISLQRKNDFNTFYQYKKYTCLQEKGL